MRWKVKASVKSCQTGFPHSQTIFSQLDSTSKTRANNAPFDSAARVLNTPFDFVVCYYHIVIVRATLRIALFFSVKVTTADSCTRLRYCVCVQLWYWKTMGLFLSTVVGGLTAM